MTVTSLLRSGARGLIRLVSWLTDLVVLLIFLLLILYTGYNVWDARQIYVQADAVRYESYKPETDDAPTFEELQARNPEVLAWLTVYGTGIDYPVAQAEDNDRYINFDVEGQFSLSGSLFLDYRNAPDFSDSSSIIFGHHMENSGMFGDLDQFGQQSYFEERRYGSLYYDGRSHGLEFFAYLDADAYDGVIYSTSVGESMPMQEFLDYLEAHATYWCETATAEDRVLLLSTCGTGTNERYVLAARITDQTYSDPFAEEEVSVQRTLFGAEGEQFFSGWRLYAVVLLVVLLVLMIIVLLVGRNNRKNK